VVRNFLPHEESVEFDPLELQLAPSLVTLTASAILFSPEERRFVRQERQQFQQQSDLPDRRDVFDRSSFT
jgi:hypothetical protein